MRIAGPSRIRYIVADLTAFLVGAVRQVSLRWAKASVASQDDLSKRGEGQFAIGTGLGGAGSAFIRELDAPVDDRIFIVLDIISDDATERSVAWSVTGHDE